MISLNIFKLKEAIPNTKPVVGIYGPEHFRFGFYAHDYLMSQLRRESEMGRC